MAPNAGQHRIVVEEDEHSDAPYGPFRWSCLCRRVGKWVAESADAQRGGAAHERRFAPKKPQGPKAVRNLLKFED